MCDARIDAGALLTVRILAGVGWRRLQREEAGSVAFGDENGGDLGLESCNLELGRALCVGSADLAKFAAADFGVLSGCVLARRSFDRTQTYPGSTPSR